MEEFTTEVNLENITPLTNKVYGMSIYSYRSANGRQTTRKMTHTQSYQSNTYSWQAFSIAGPIMQNSKPSCARDPSHNTASCIPFWLKHVFF